MNKDSVSLAYLRAFVTVLVLAFHSVAAYVSFAPKTNTFSARSSVWLAFPVVDQARWVGFDLFFLFNDSFFMAMMFLISGLFVWESVRRKGTRQYLRDRLVRLGMPFVVVALIAIPVAYYPSYALTSSAPSVTDYLYQYWSLPVWPVGPCWFIGILLVFDVLAALLIGKAGKQVGTIGKLLLNTQARPVKLYFVLGAFSLLLYFPMVAAFGPLRWFTLGPLQIAAGRSLLYLFWFFVGVGIGVGGIQKGLLDSAGVFARRWPAWTAMALLSFVALIYGLLQIKKGGGHTAPLTGLLTGTAFIACSTAAIFMLLALFTKYVRRSNPVGDSIAANAYGMYLVHYVFVTWTQYFVFDQDMSAVSKAAIVFAVTLLLSWGCVVLVRQVSFVNRILSTQGRLRNGEATRIA